MKDLLLFVMLGLVLLAQTAMVLETGSSGVCAAGSRVYFRLLEKFDASPDSKLLRFELPQKILRIPTHTQDGAYRAPTGVHCIANLTTSPDGELKKSYSPVSLPDAEGHLDLLVKAYPPRPGGGLGAHLCALEPGDQILMEIKAPRSIHGSTNIAARWKRLAFVAGGTGVAPMLQMIRFLLAKPDDNTELWLLSINRHEQDILMRHELDALATAHPRRFHVTYSLTQPPVGWKGAVGRGTVSMAIDALPAPSLPRDKEGDAGAWGAAVEVQESTGGAHADSDVMVMVCGTDGFVETWAGALERRKDAVTGHTVKVQGALEGLLKAAGFKENEVYKF